MYTRKIYASVAADTNNAANIIVPRNSTLIAVQWGLKVDAITDNAEMVAELSLASANEIGVNDAQLCISEVCQTFNFVTSGLYGGGLNLYVPVSIPLTQGQKVYYHCFITGTITIIGGAVLWFA